MLFVALALLLAQATDFQSEGLKALDAQKYGQAAEFFSKAVAADPKDYAAHFHLALAFSLLNKDDEAIAGYRKTLELSPGLYQAELNLAILLVGRKEFTEAIPHLKSAVEKKPKEFRPNYYLAEALAGARDFDSAVAAYHAAIAIDPAAKDAELGLARALAAQERWSDAEAHFLKVGGDAIIELAAIYQEKNRLEDAARIYARLSDNAAAQERGGVILLSMGDAAGAVPMLERAVALSPTTANRAALAQALLKAKQADRALALLGQLVAAEPRDPQLRLFYGRALRDQRDYPAAWDQFVAASQLQTASVEAWNEIASIAIITEKHSQALAALDRVKSLGGEIPEHHYFRAITYDKLRQPKLALEYYEKFLASAEGKHPDEEFKARQRSRLLKNDLSK